MPAEIPQTFKGTENTPENTPEKFIYTAPETDLGLADDDLADRIDKTFVWLRQRKNLKHLPQSEWVTLFTLLEAEGITLDKFQEFYIWVENLDWVKGAVSVKLLTGQIEAYKNREYFEAKRKIKDGSNNTNTGQKGRGENVGHDRSNTQQTLGNIRRRITKPNVRV